MKFSAKHGLATVTFALCGVLLAMPSSAQRKGHPGGVADVASGTNGSKAADAGLVGTEEAIALGSRTLGETCTKDCQCASKECKGFKCITRDLSEHPVLPKGASCAFDGDCGSCDCAGGTCK